MQALSPLLAYQSAYTVFHFSGCLVGKGQRQNIPRLISMLQQIGNLIGQHTRLTRSGTGYHQLGAITIDNGFALSFVECMEYFFFYHSCSIYPIFRFSAGLMESKRKS